MAANNRAIDAFFSGEMLPVENIHQDLKVFTVKMISEKKEKKPNPRTNAGTTYVQQYQKVLETDLARTFTSLNLTGITVNDTNNFPLCDNTNNTSKIEAEDRISRFDDKNYGQRKDLPIFKFKNEILQQIRTHPVTIIRGLTGCGKTTQVCQYILDDCNARSELCNILVSQPRKIAAITVAQRVCQERNITLGTTIGYQVGLNKKINMTEDEITQITFCTTGVILQKLINEKSMAKYSHIILDEVHERDIDIDFLIILVRRFLALNSPLTKIILMSATLDSEKFQEFFKIPLNESIENEYIYPPIIDLNSAKRTYEITEKYLDDLSSLLLDYVNFIDYQEPGITNEMYELAAKLITVLIKSSKNKIDQKKSRNILVFLPGIHEIERLQEELEIDIIKQQIKSQNVEVHVLHSSLSTEEQRNAFGFSNKTKIILSTNIAESSVTLPNIVYVIDFCLTKNLTSRQGTQMSSLILSWATKNNCKQRAGRTGRVMSGVVYRLVHKEFYTKKMSEQAIPEIRLIPLESVVIKIKKLEMGTPLEILAVSLDPPDESKVVDAVLSLKEFGGLFRFNKDGKFEYNDGDLTFLGEIMSSMPCDIRITRLMILGYIFSVLEETIIIGAGLNIKGIFLHSISDKMGSYVNKVKWSNGSASDCIAIYNAYTTWAYKHDHRFFKSIDEERTWCNSKGLDLKNLNEMRLLIIEFKKRLECYKILILQDFNQPRWLTNEKIFILKVVLAGAFGVSNFFQPDYRDNMERDTYKIADEYDLRRTVYFRGFDKNYIGEIYRERIKEMLVEKGVCKRETKVDIFFSTKSSGQTYVTFESDDYDFDDDFNFDLNNVAPEVYKAVKLRQINNEFKIPVLNPIQTMYYAQDKGLGEISENGFDYNLYYLSKPEYFPLPTQTTDKMKGKITHVEDCSKFYFRPEIAYCSVLEKKDDIYVKAVEELRNKLYAATIVPITYPASHFKSGRFCIYVNGKEIKNFDKLERAKFVRVCSNGRIIINLMDRGANIEATQNDLYDITNSKMLAEILSYPRQVFECRLKEVQPSHQKLYDGKWTPEAIDLFRKETILNDSIIEIFSVIDNVVTVDLKTLKSEFETIHWNKELVEAGYGEECEESYLSKSNHLMRKTLYYTASEMSDPKEEFKQFVDKELVQRYIESPPKSKCYDRITLTGPFSPLEKNLRGVSTILNNHVNIDSSSVNQIFLDDEFYKHHGKFFVAADLTCSGRNQNIKIRETTKMPNIQGLSVILALIFAPYAEIRRDIDKDRYISIITGLGYDEENDRPYFEERDASLIVDFSLSPEDIFKINNLRLIMSNLLYTTPLDKIPNVNDSTRAIFLNKIKDIFVSLINKKNNLYDVQYPKDLFKWMIDQDDAKKLTNTLGYRAIFEYHAIPLLIPLSREKREKLKKYVTGLERGTSMTLVRECKICDKPIDSEIDLKFHLMSLMHTNRKKALEL